MRVSIFLALISAAFAAAAPNVVASTQTEANADAYILAGPLPYNELKAKVATLNIEDRIIAGRDLEKRICEGVYMCDGTNFTGSCYFGCYPVNDPIFPDPYWVTRISSVGPDQGGRCTFYGGNACDGSKFASQTFGYPGGNLAFGIDNNMGCFTCTSS